MIIHTFIIFSGLLGWSRGPAYHYPWSHTCIQNQICGSGSCNQGQCICCFRVRTAYLTHHHCYKLHFGYAVVGLTLLASLIAVSHEIKFIFNKMFIIFSYPLILSLENHCSIPQQKVMAQTFRDVFGGL